MNLLLQKYRHHHHHQVGVFRITKDLIQAKIISFLTSC